METKGFNRRDFLKVFGAGAASMALTGCQTNNLPFARYFSKKRPNILVIYTDDQSYRTIKSHPRGHTWVKTPNIDRLAKEGMQFTAGYCGAWCMAARASFLTGHQTHGVQTLRRVGGYPGSKYDPSVCRFWPSEFRKAGYTTGFIGKWHLSEDTGQGRDWDHSVVWNHAVPDKAGGYQINQKLNFDGGPYTPVGGHSTDNYTSYALNFINKELQKPWFLWLCYDAVHGPNIIVERDKNAYPDPEPCAIPVDFDPPREGKPEYSKYWDTRGCDKNAIPSGMRRYSRGVLALDEGVGKIIKALEQKDQLDNTFIVFTSDQGFAQGHHGFFWKVAPYDENILAPFIIRMPGVVSEDTLCNHPVSQLDLIPTFFKLAGVPLPWQMHGHDMTKILKDPQAEWEHPLLMEYMGQRYGSDTDKGKGSPDPKDGDLLWQGKDNKIPIPWWVSLRQGRYKYIRNLTDNEIEELYDMVIDPQELNNLALNRSYKKVLEDYRQRLINELKRTDAGLVDNMPEPKKMI